MNSKKEIVKMLLNQDLGQKDEEELLDMLINHPVSVDIDKEVEKRITLGEKLADKISIIIGSWVFIICFLVFLLLWIFFNEKIDPYPFILLNLILSCVASIQAPIIMMSQNREAKKDSMRNKNDYKTDLKSELILEDLHDKMELILKNQFKLLNLLDKKN